MSKKYVITEKENNIIIAMGVELSVQENGNWWLVASNTAYPNSFCNAFDANGQIANTTNPKSIGEGIEVPVSEAGLPKVEPGSWCYDAEHGFYLNPEKVTNEESLEG